MTKAKNPLFSFQSVGRFAKHFTTKKHHLDSIIEPKPHPLDVRSDEQLTWRTMYQKCTDLWHLLTAAEKQEWESAARRKHMTGYAWYMSQCLRPNPGIYLPLAGGTMQGAIDMASQRVKSLPIPAYDQDAATKKYVDDELDPTQTCSGRWYRNTTQACNTGTWNTVQFNTTRWERGCVLGYPGPPYKVTLLKSGIWYVSVTIRWQPIGGGEINCFVKVNNTTVIVNSHQLSDAVMSGAMVFSTVWEFTGGDWIEVVFYHNTGGWLSIWGTPAYSPELAVALIR